MDRPRLHRPDPLVDVCADPDVAAEMLDVLRRRLPQAAFDGLVRAVEREAATMLERERGHVIVR